MTTLAGTCPKCSFRGNPQADSCIQCGLVFAKWKPDVVPRLVPLDDAALRLWALAERNWTDRATHDTFTRHCAASEQLPAAARRYREWLVAHPGDEMAAKMQARVVSMVTALTFAIPSQRPTPLTRSSRFLVMIAISLVGSAALAIFRSVLK
jgi:hypothetical protein